MGVMAEIRGALAGGATKEQLEAAGYKRSSIYQAQKQLVKPGDVRRRTKVQPANQVPNPIRVGSPALPAPSSELSDMREQVQLVKLGNDLAVAKQQAERLQPEPPKPPTEIDNARAMVGLFSDLKTLFPPPEPSAQTPGPGDSKLSSVQLLNLDIARMESQERQLIREEERALQQVEQQAELVKEVGGHISKGLGFLLKVFQEVKAATPARVPDVRAPALNPKAPALEGAGKFPAMTQSSPGVWVRPSPPNTDVVPSEDVMLKPADRAGGVWIASVDPGSEEVTSWAWAPDPPKETVRERLARVGQRAAGQNSSRVV